MTVRTITINLNALEVYEAGATLITLLAYPLKSDSDEIRGALHQSLCAIALHNRVAVSPDWAKAPQSIKPIYALRSEAEINRDIRTLERRLRDRMIAAKMAIALLQEAQTGQLPKLPAGIARMSINQLATMVVEESKQGNPENVKARVWRASLPAIHLAAATQILMSEVERLKLGRITFWSLLDNRGVIEWVIENAQALERLFKKSRYRRVDLNALIRLRLVKE